MTEFTKEEWALMAKAAGYTLKDYYVHGVYWPWCVEIGDNWHPLADDGDAFRLMVKLHFHFDAAHYVMRVTDTDNYAVLDSERGDGDNRLANARLAICRAAIELGRRM